ncbi:MAG TPA: hypothetical protein DCZ94_05900 [Lentisphaeria bacterium]|nr:MAG: hypothetical protein A2X48_07410 [Lentisphaerae bacterium GWF2_49_21]HBC86469.1 hypothetical protein [Lentisphaeria bacterium]
MKERKDRMEIRYLVSKETKTRLKGLSESWKVKPRIALELAILKSENSLKPRNNDDFHRRLDDIETALARILTELTGNEEIQ